VARAPLIVKTPGKVAGGAQKRCEEVGRSQRQILHSQASDRHLEFNTARRAGSTGVFCGVLQALLGDFLAFFLHFRLLGLFLNLIIFERRVKVFGQIHVDVSVGMLGPDQRGNHGTEQHYRDEDE
jgi:hypothetical protein